MFMLKSCKHKYDLVHRFGSLADLDMRFSLRSVFGKIWGACCFTRMDDCGAAATLSGHLARSARTCKLIFHFLFR